MLPNWSQNVYRIIPRPPPHPQLGKTKLPRGKTNRKKYVFDDFHVFYFQSFKNGPKMVPGPSPHLQLG